MRRFNKYYLGLMALFLFWLPQAAVGQNVQQNQDSLITRNTIADSIKTTSGSQEFEGDIVLEEISIEAIIEKPRVSFLPKRIDPEFGELEFVDRSFERELKKIPNNLMISDKRLFQPNKIGNLKNKLLKKKENKNKE